MTKVSLIDLEIHYIAREQHNMGSKPPREELSRYITEQGRRGCYKLHVPKNVFQQTTLEDIVEELQGAFNLVPQGYTWLNDEEKFIVANWIRKESLDVA